MNAILAKSLLTTGSLLLLSFAPVALSAAADQPPSTKARSLAKLYPYGERAQDVIGISVRGHAGEDFGKLKDLVIDPQSGRIVYAIVSTGGVLGVGGTERAVPFSAISYSDAREYLRVGTTLADWQRAPIYKTDQFAALADQERADDIYRHYNQTWEPILGDPTLASSTSPRLQLATSLIGRNVHAGDQLIGEAEDLILNVGSRRAQVLLRADPKIAGTSGHFVVPFRKLTASADDPGRLTTTLTREDFQSGPTFDNNAWNDQSNDSIYRWKLASPTPSHVSE